MNEDAALLESQARAHPLVDGNERLARVAVRISVRLQEWRPSPTA